MEWKANGICVKVLIYTENACNNVITQKAENLYEREVSVKLQPTLADNFLRKKFFINKRHLHKNT